MLSNEGDSWYEHRYELGKNSNKNKAIFYKRKTTK